MPVLSLYHRLAAEGGEFLHPYPGNGNGQCELAPFFKKMLLLGLPCANAPMPDPACSIN
jgi:hypothetical protein